jgi:hypothetical protein
VVHDVRVSTTHLHLHAHVSRRRHLLAPPTHILHRRYDYPRAQIQPPEFLARYAQNEGDHDVSSNPVSTHTPSRASSAYFDSSDDLGNNDAEDVGSERVSLIIKKLKTGLRKEGLESARGSRDQWYWLERERSGYSVLEEDVRGRIRDGKAKL